MYFCDSYQIEVRPTIVNCLFPIPVRLNIPCGQVVIIYYINKFYYLISRILKRAHQLLIAVSLRFRRANFKVGCNFKDFA